jgi:S-adenosyl methyltransferase
VTGRPSAGAPRESGVSGSAHAQVCGSRNRPYIPEIDTSTAHVARVYDYMLGGVNNFEVDRLAAERSAEPAGGIEAWRHSTRSNRAFLDRVVRWLVEECGIRQFLDLGSGLPTEQNVHQVAQSAAPESRIVYVDIDAIVLAQAHTLLSGTPEGTTRFLVADMTDPNSILGDAAQTLDFNQPIAVLMFTILHTVLDQADPWATVARYVDAVSSGSHLAISHLTGDFNPEVMAQVKDALDEDMAEPFVLRSRDEILRFFSGTDLVEPGVVHINDWHLEIAPSPPPPAGDVAAPIYAGVGRKP